MAALSLLRPRAALLAAELVLDKAQPGALQALIDESIDAGFMSEHCLDALAEPPTLEAIRPAFAELMRELALDWPQPAQAYPQIVRARLRAMQGGELDPLRDLREVIELSWDSRELLPDRVYAGDGLGLQRLLALWSLIGDMADMQHPVFDGVEGEAAWAALRSHILDAAREWLREHGESRMGVIP